MISSRTGVRIAIAVAGLSAAFVAVCSGSLTASAQTPAPTPVPTATTLPAPTTPAPTALPDLIVDNTRVTLSGSHEFRNVIIRNRGRVEIDPYSGTDSSGRLEIRAERIELDGTSTILGDFAGYRGRRNDTGEGPGGGEGGRHTVDGGAGGGYGGRGGDGVLDNTGQPGARGGQTYGDDCSRDIERGSAGGAPGTADNPGETGAGANGGAAVALIADTVILAGTISLNGDDGVVVANDASGGGAGGGLLVVARTLDHTGRVTADGGDGGNTDDGGGGGGGGRIKFLFASGTATRRMLSVDGGRGDGNGYPNNGRPGTICIQQEAPSPTPTPTDTAVPTRTPSPTPTAVPTDTSVPTATSTVTPSPTQTATPTATPSPTPTPATRYLPLALREHCPKSDRPPVDLAIVLDASTSMQETTRAGRRKIDAALDAVSIPIDMLGSADRMAIITFNDEAHVVVPLTSDAATLRAGSSAVTIRQGSDLAAGVRSAAQHLTDDATRFDGVDLHMVIVTDGLCNPTTPAAADLAAADARAAGIVVVTVAVGDQVAAGLLQSMAGDPDRYHEAPDAEDLDEVFEALFRMPPACGGRRMWGDRRSP